MLSKEAAILKSTPSNRKRDVPEERKANLASPVSPSVKLNVNRLSNCVGVTRGVTLIQERRWTLLLLLYVIVIFGMSITGVIVKVRNS